MTEDGRRSQSRRISIPEGWVVDDGHVKRGGKQKAGVRNGGATSIAELQNSTTIKQEGDKLFGKQKIQVKQ